MAENTWVSLGLKVITLIIGVKCSAFIAGFRAHLNDLENCDFVEVGYSE